MKITMEKLKKIAACLSIAAFVTQIGAETASAASIPPVTWTVTTSFSNLISTPIQLNNVQWMKWQTPGTTGSSPTVIASCPAAGCPLTFAYFANGGNNLAYPSRTAPNDNTANNQSDLWSEYGVEVSFTPGNQTNQGVVIGTNNTPATGQPFVGAGLIGADGISVVPLLWKAITLADLQGASGASGTTASTIKVPYNPTANPPVINAVWMPTEITSQTGGACPTGTAEGQYSGSAARTNNGFCDYSVHYMNDYNSPTWYTKLTGAAQTASFNYSSLIGAYGINSTEQGAGGLGKNSPAYFILGASVANAIPEGYSATITVEAASH